MSFWMLPRSFDGAIPRSSAATRYIAQITEAGLLIVIDVLTSPTSIPRKRRRMSSRDDTATPHVPNSPFASGSSVSYPYRVGMSKATLRPVSPWAMRYLNRRFVFFPPPHPADNPLLPPPPRGLGGVVSPGEGETPRVPKPPSRVPAAPG